MRDDFVCDIGDFGKYGLLRHLVGATGLSLGVLWMRTRARGASRGNRAYLDDPHGNRRVAECDRDLFDTLAELKTQDRCSLHAIEQSAVLPQDTVYHAEPLDDFPPRGSPAQVLTDRAQWFASAVTALAQADVVFLDPDTGLEVPSVPLSRASNVRYVYYDELTDFWNQDQSLLVYHHLPRRPAEDEIRRRGRDLLAALPGARIWSLRWHRVQGRVYFLACQPQHADTFASAVHEFEHTCWCTQDHFSVIEFSEPAGQARNVMSCNP